MSFVSTSNDLLLTIPLITLAFSTTFVICKAVHTFFAAKETPLVIIDQYYHFIFYYSMAFVTHDIHGPV
jgi:hypothetical protein